MTFSDFLKRLFKPREINRDNGVKLSPEMLPVIIQSLEQTKLEEYTCDQVYELLDQFAEMIYRGEDASRMMPLVQHHLDMCGDCREEFEALLSILQSQNVG